MYYDNQKAANNSCNQLKDASLTQDIEKISSSLDDNTNQINSLINLLPADILLQVLPDFLSINESYQTNSAKLTNMHTKDPPISKDSVEFNNETPSKDQKTEEQNNFNASFSDQIDLISSAINNNTILINLLLKVIPPEILAEMPGFDLMTNQISTNITNKTQDNQTRRTVNTIETETKSKTKDIQSKPYQTEIKSTSKEINSDLTIRSNHKREIVFFPSNDIYPKSEEFQNQNKHLNLPLINRQNSIKNKKYSISFHKKIQFLNFSNKRPLINSNNKKSRFTMVTSVVSESTSKSVKTVNNYTLSKIFIIANIYSFNFSNKIEAIENLPYQLSGIIGIVDIFEKEKPNIYTEIDKSVINVHMIKNVKNKNEEEKAEIIKNDENLDEDENVVDIQNDELDRIEINNNSSEFENEIVRHIENNFEEVENIEIKNSDSNSDDKNSITDKPLLEIIEEEEEVGDDSEPNRNQEEEDTLKTYKTVIEEEERNEIIDNSETSNKDDDDDEITSNRNDENSEDEIIINRHELIIEEEEEERNEIFNNSKTSDNNNEEEEESTSNRHKENIIVEDVEIVEKPEISLNENTENYQIVERHTGNNSQSLAVGGSNDNSIVFSRHERRQHHHRQNNVDVTINEEIHEHHHVTRSSDIKMINGSKYEASHHQDDDDDEINNNNNKPLLPLISSTRKIEKRSSREKMNDIDLNGNSENYQIVQHHSGSNNNNIVIDGTSGNSLFVNLKQQHERHEHHETQYQEENTIITRTEEIHEHHQVFEFEYVDDGNVNEEFILNQIMSRPEFKNSQFAIEHQSSNVRSKPKVEIIEE